MCASNLHTIQEIKLINAVTISAKKNAKTATIIITSINAGFNTIDNATIADIIVPMVAASKQLVFVIKHFDNALGAVTAPKNTPTINAIKVNTPSPKAIQTAISIKVISVNENRVPIITAKTMLSTIPAKLQAVKLHLLQDII